MNKENLRNTRPISLHPLKPGEALRRAMRTPPPKDEPKAAPRKPRKPKAG